MTTINLLSTADSVVDTDLFPMYQTANSDTRKVTGSKIKEFALADLSLSSGSDQIGYLPDGSGAVAITIQDKLRETVSVKDFGAKGDGSTDDTAYVLLAIAYTKASPNNPAIYFPAGKYIIDSLLMDSMRGTAFIGEAAEDPTSTYAKTWIYWKAASTASALLTIRSCAYLSFTNINFYSNGNTGKNQLVLFQCNASTVTSPLNKFASTKIWFDKCSFVVATADSMAVATINLKSTALVTFRGGVIFGENAVKIGADSDVSPVDGGATIPNGRSVQTSFDKVQFRGNIIRERILGVAYDGCFFSENSVPDGSDLEISYLSVSGNQEVRNEIMTNCVCDTSAVTKNVSVWCDTPSSPPAGASPTFTAVNNQLNGAGTIFDLKSGVATIKGNKFVAELKTGAATYNAVRLNSGLLKFDIEGNDYEGLLALNSGTVIATAVSDIRSSFEDDKYILARSLGTDFALTNNSYTSVLSRTLTNVAGGLVEVSYAITITSAIDTTFTARLVLDGTAIDGTYSRYTTNTGSSKTFVLNFPTRIVKLAATSLAATRVLKLEVIQNTGATYATIRGDSYVLSSTFATAKVITS
jgi:hypothetical protein